MIPTRARIFTVCLFTAITLRDDGGKQKIHTLDPPEQEKSLRSGAEQVDAKIRFVNRTARDVTLYWIDTGGVRHSYGKIGAGERAVQSTFASHVRLVAGPDDRALALFVAGPPQGLAIIR